MRVIVSVCLPKSQLFLFFSVNTAVLFGPVDFTAFCRSSLSSVYKTSVSLLIVSVGWSGDRVLASQWRQERFGSGSKGCVKTLWLYIVSSFSLVRPHLCLQGRLKVIAIFIFRLDFVKVHSHF